MADDEATRLTPRSGSGSLTEVSISRERIEPGVEIGAYVIEGLLGIGGCASVYAVRHKVLGRNCAIKILHKELVSSENMVGRFLREARVVNKIRHPNIVDIYEFGMFDDGRPFFVMELLGGKNLRDVVSLDGRRSPLEMLEIAAPVCSALEAAHGQGVVHRDIKPSNVNVQSSGGRLTVKLLDFGVAKLLYPDAGEQGLTAEGTQIGTTTVMSPEQILGLAVDSRSDIYAMGVLCYFMLTGRYPFDADTRLELERQHLQAPPPRPSALVPVPPAVDSVILRCLHKKAEGRYASAQQLLDHLREAVLGPSAPAASVERQAIAVHVSIPLPPGGEDDDELVLELTDKLDVAETELRAMGLNIVPQTGTQLLGVKLLPTGSADAKGVRHAVIDAARALHETLRTSDGALRAELCVHAGPAELSTGTDGVPSFSGGIVRTEEWLQGGSEGWAVTQAAAD